MPLRGMAMEADSALFLAVFDSDGEVEQGGAHAGGAGGGRVAAVGRGRSMEWEGGGSQWPAVRGGAAGFIAR